MLNHIAVRQLETADNKDRIERIFGKMDQLLIQQKLLLKTAGFRSFQSEDSSDQEPGTV